MESEDKGVYNYKQITVVQFHKDDLSSGWYGECTECKTSSFPCKHVSNSTWYKLFYEIAAIQSLKHL